MFEEKFRADTLLSTDGVSSFLRCMVYLPLSVPNATLETFRPSLLQRIVESHVIMAEVREDVDYFTSNNDCQIVKPFGVR